MKLAVLSLLLAAPLAAQNFEVGLFIGQQSYKSFTFNGFLVPGDKFKVEPKKKTVTGLRFGYSVVDLGPASLQLTAGFQPEAKSDVEFSYNGTVVPFSDTKYSHKHWSVGAMFNFKAFVAIGAGLEYRSESLKTEFAGGGESTTYGRPWARVNAGIAFPTPLVKPFVGLEVALPLASTSPTQAQYLGADASYGLKAHAPKMQIGLYGGIRF